MAAVGSQKVELPLVILQVMKRSHSIALIAAAFFLVGLEGCSAQKSATPAESAGPKTTPKAVDALPGMPPVEDPSDIYAADHAGNLSATVRAFPARIYVPNSGSDTVDMH